MIVRSSRRLTAPVIFSLFLSACGGSATTTPPVATSSADQLFITGASQASNAEIGAAKIALQRSSNTDVIAFANEMITQHTQEEQALAPIAATAGFTVPPPTSLNPVQQQQAAMLMATAEPAFDGVYVNGEISGHQANIANNYNPELTYGKVSQVVSYAQTYLPQVQMHLQMAQGIKTTYNF